MSDTQAQPVPSLVELLTSVLPQPSLLRSQAGGATLALVMHCLMLRDGFQPLEVQEGGAAGPPLKPGALLPADWNKGEGVWVFEYTRPLAVKKFRLACSLHPTTRRMFIHAAEVEAGSGEPEAGNMCVMGLQQDNYVPAGDAVSRSSSWQGVVHNQQALTDMYSEFVGGPLWRRAERAAPAHRSSSWLALASPARKQQALALAAAACASTAVLLLMWRRRSSAA